MKKITYAGESVLTSDDVASALVELCAALARKGQADAVIIPICAEDGSDHRTAELVIGQGNDVLAVPVDGDDADPDFATASDELRSKIAALSNTTSIAAAHPTTETDGFDYDLDGLDEV